MQALPKDDTPAGPANNKVDQFGEWLHLRYKTRWNAIRPRPEVLIDGHWVPITDRMMNTWRMDFRRAEKISISKDQFKELMNSEFNELINPIQEYFAELPKPDYRGGNIEKLAATVTMAPEDAQRWPEYLKKWMVACVANSLTLKGCQNHTALIFTGGQGIGKTTWLQNLCPDALIDDYYQASQINPENKESLAAITENFLLNIDDQLHTINKKSSEALKNLITLDRVKYRRPYAAMMEDYPRIANFMGSANGRQYLTDDTGSRRFLSFEVEKINFNAMREIDINKCWSEAAELWRNKFQYWFTLEDNELINQHNERFRMATVEEELIEKYYQPASSQLSGTFMNTSEIMASLMQESGIKNLSIRRTGSALTKLGFKKTQSEIDNRRRSGYWVEFQYE